MNSSQSGTEFRQHSETNAKKRIFRPFIFIDATSAGEQLMAQTKVQEDPGALQTQHHGIGDGHAFGDKLNVNNQNEVQISNIERDNSKK